MALRAVRLGTSSKHKPRAGSGRSVALGGNHFWNYDDALWDETSGGAAVPEPPAANSFFAPRRLGEGAAAASSSSSSTPAGAGTYESTGMRWDETKLEDRWLVGATTSASGECSSSCFESTFSPRGGPDGGRATGTYVVVADQRSCSVDKRGSANVRWAQWMGGKRAKISSSSIEFSEQFARTSSDPLVGAPLEFVRRGVAAAG